MELTSPAVPQFSPDLFQSGLHRRRGKDLEILRWQPFDPILLR